MTATTRQALILDALFTHAELMEGQGPTLPTALPEQKPPFVVPDDGRFLSVSALPNVPKWAGLAAGAVDQGILQVLVVWPKGAGLIAPAAAADLVMAHFNRNRRLVNGAVRVKIGQATLGAPLTEPDKVSLPISIYWTA